MRRIAFWSPKGGAGKTTLALNFAAAAYFAGNKVILCDLDPQQSAADVFSENNLPFTVLNQRPPVPPNVDFLICDYSPSMENLPKEETVIVPMRASVLDYKAVTKANRLIRNKRIIKCVNAVDTRRHEERLMALKLYADGAHLVKDRSVYVRCLAAGQTVFQQNVYGAKDAQEEMNRLLNRVLSVE